MKQICNIFNPIAKSNGNFLLFSQYVEDISKSVVNASYRVRPSQFVCLNLNNDVQSNAMSLCSGAGSYTKYIPGYLQNYFENGISVLKKTEDLSPFNFAIGFIDKLVELTKNGTSINLQSYVKYIGNIDLESWEDGFSDIILDINSGAEGIDYQLASYIGGVSLSGLNITQFSDGCCGRKQYNNEQIGGAYHICGWGNEETPITSNVSATGTIGVGAKDGWNNPWSLDIPVFNQLILPSSTTHDSFTFNTIILFYDVEDTVSNIIYTGIPLGIYFTGNGESSGISNGVTIYKSSDVAYGAGSGWSLRICTKFAPTPYGNLQVEEVALESKSITSSISALMSATAEAIKAVNSFAEKPLVNIQAIKDELSRFKNTRTNVPYAKLINGVGYWFVNGRNTGVRTDGTVDENAL